MFLKPNIIVTVQAMLSLSLASMGNCNFDLSWLDDLPAADDTKLHDGMTAGFAFANARVLIAEVLEWQRRHKEAIRCENIIYSSARPVMCVTCFCLCNHSFAVAELQADSNFCASSKVRAGRVLGRCHAALGEHALSVSAFDAAIQLASVGRFLLSEALAIRDRARAGQGTGGSRLHWDECTRAHGESATGGDDGAHAGRRRAAGAAACLAGADGPKRDESGQDDSQKKDAKKL
jgi:hypothetical protein